MLMINATRHHETSFGVYGPGRITVMSRLSGKRRSNPPVTRQKFKIGVGNEYLDQILGRPADLC
jgi:hypothetical protein